MAIDKYHYVHSRNGRIGDGTDHDPADIDAILTALLASGAKRLVVHFHGGLVSKADGLDIASRLMDVYSPPGSNDCYPIFFVWESGAIETVRNNLADIANEPIFRQLVRKLLEFTLSHTGVQDATRSVIGANVRPGDVRDVINAWFSNPSQPVPYLDASPASSAEETRAVVSAVNENDIQRNLEYDAEFLAALQSIADVPTDVRSAIGLGSIAHLPTKLNASTLTLIAPSPSENARGFVMLAKVAWLIAKILGRVIERIASSRDHGFYATAVEEILRECYGDMIGQSIFWNQMKKDTADAFGGNRDLHVGTAFIARLKDAMAKGLALEKIFLVGHSTGGIYISHFLDAIDDMGPNSNVQFDVVLLAPANDYKLFNETISKHGARIRSLRMFGMKDGVEREDGLLGDDWKRILYPSSLLYFVSGLLEAEPDTPIVGMQRFLVNKNVFTAPDFPEADTVRTWLAQPPGRQVWSKTNNGNGQCSQARKHGDFDDDLDTLKSLTWIVTH